MAFQPPTFNLTCNVWRVLGAGGAYAAPDLVTVCNLSLGKRTLVVTSGHPVGSFPQLKMELLLPMRTDIRASWNGASEDLVEVPAGSLRFYGVYWVDDVGRGFLNEYRLALLDYFATGNATLAGGPFPAPVPLP